MEYQKRPTESTPILLITVLSKEMDSNNEQSIYIKLSKEYIGLSFSYKFSIFLLSTFQTLSEHIFQYPLARYLKFVCNGILKTYHLRWEPLKNFLYFSLIFNTRSI